MHDPLPLLMDSDFPPIKRKSLDVLQVNITLKCNQQCLHCHVNASPKRTEFMSNEIIELLLELISYQNIQTLDITGGAPELHPQFRYLVKQAKKRNVHVIDRCNLTVLFEPGMEDLASFLASHRVEIIASLPCYLEDNVDLQRGKGVFKKSIEALQLLNKFGYGSGSEELLINLVYNPQGPTLPPAQSELEMTYKHILFKNYNIRFNRLLTLCNMPIKRFGSTLISNNKFDNYLSLLKNSHKIENLDTVMCRNMISIDWQGNVYDCDFNQMLGLNIKKENNHNLNINDIIREGRNDQSIVIADHCYGCTAGQGSSCGGALQR